MKGSDLFAMARATVRQADARTTATRPLQQCGRGSHRRSHRGECGAMRLHCAWRRAGAARRADFRPAFASARAFGRRHGFV